MNLPKAKLDNEEAMRLWIEEHSEYAKEQLMLNNICLVGMVIRRYGLSILDDDLFANGMVGLVKAINGFDAMKECAFSTYAILCIKHELLMPFRKKRIKATFSLDEPIVLESGDTISFEDIVSDNKRFEDDIECVISLEQFEDGLSEKERNILAMIKMGMTQRQMAEVCGVSQTWISRIVRKMREKYKKTKYMIGENTMANVISLFQMVQQGMKDNIYNFTKNGKCSSCGNCCSNLLPMSQKEVKIIHKYVKKHVIKECVHKPPTKESVHDMTCPFRDNNKSICTIYEVRPKICKQFICDSEKRAKHNRKLLGQTRNIVDVRSEFFDKT